MSKREHSVRPEPSISNAGLAHLTPRELGEAATAMRKALSAEGFKEVCLGPFDAFLVEADGALPISGSRQLRFNTEPEIWSSAQTLDSFFSVTTLFREEKRYTPLHRPAFTIVDFYLKGSVDEVEALFLRVVKALGDDGVLTALPYLQIRRTLYDSATDGPSDQVDGSNLTVVEGYTPDSSFFEVDDRGVSTRCEIFLTTDLGRIELAAMGIIGTNINPAYAISPSPPVPPVGYSGMGIGLERLLIADRLAGGTLDDWRAAAGE